MNMKKSKNIGLIGLLALFLIIILIPKADATASFTQSTTLRPDWNIVSTPRVVDSHTFSAAETSSNFDIFVLNASSTSGWSTMEDLGQTEFTPLYSYFINNKTGIEQSLSLTYKTGLSPNNRLFQRTFTKTGWYSIGAANPTYIKAQCGDTNDINNVGSILDSATGNYSTVIDFTDADFSTDPSSVALSDAWKAVVPSDINSLHDLRELKGYAIFITKENALLNGFQNEDSISTCQGVFTAQKNSSMGSGNLVLGQSNAKIASFVLSVSGESINVSDITLTSSSTFPFANLLIKVNGIQFGNIKGSVTTNTDFTFSGTSPISIPLGGSITVDVYADVLSTATNDGLSYYVKLKDSSALGVITGATQILKNSDGSAVSTNSINGQSITITTSGPILTLDNDASSPAAYQIVMGKTNQTLGIWRVNGGTTEDANINEIAIKDRIGTSGDEASFENLQWYKGGVAVGPVVVSATASGTAGSETGYLYTWTFNTPVVVPQNGGITLELRGNVSSFASGGSTSNSTHIFGFNRDNAYLKARGSGSSLTAVVNDSAATALGKDDTFDGSNDTTTEVKTLTVTRTKLTVTSDPTGILTTGHAPQSADVMAVFVFTADPAYDVTVSTVTLRLAGATLATINVRLLDADTNTAWGSSANRAVFGLDPDTGMTAGASSSVAFYPDYVLSAGATKRVKVVADTTGSETASDATFTVTAGSTSGTLAQWYIDNDTSGSNGSVVGNAACWGDGTTTCSSSTGGFNLENKVLPIYGPSVRY